MQHWPETPVADRRALHRRIGCKLSPLAHGIFGVVRKAVRCKFAGVQVGVPDLAARFDVTPRQVFRVLNTLEAHQLVRRVHQFVDLPWTCPATKRSYTRRQSASVLLLGAAAGAPPSPSRRRACTAKIRVENVTPKPTPSCLSDRRRGVGKDPENAAAPREGAGCAGESTRARSGADTLGELARAALEALERRDTTDDDTAAKDGGTASAQVARPGAPATSEAPEGPRVAPLEGWLPASPDELLALEQPPLGDLCSPRPVPRVADPAAPVSAVPVSLRELTRDELEAGRRAVLAELAARGLPPPPFCGVRALRVADTNANDTTRNDTADTNANANGGAP